MNLKPDEVTAYERIKVLSGLHWRLVRAVYTWQRDNGRWERRQRWELLDGDIDDFTALICSGKTLREVLTGLEARIASGEMK
jgi:hypothetical protein